MDILSYNTFGEESITFLAVWRIDSALCRRRHLGSGSGTIDSAALRAYFAMVRALYC